MQMRFSEPLFQIMRHFERILENMTPEQASRFGTMLNETWGVKEADRERIEEEMEAFRYLVSLRRDIAYGTDVNRPTKEVLDRALERHLRFLDTIHNVRHENFRKSNQVLAVKEYKACRHYLFKSSLPGWWKSLPEEVLCFESKYPDFER